MFNGPRAHVNFNDGFGGGALLASNLIFNSEFMARIREGQGWGAEERKGREAKGTERLSNAFPTNISPLHFFASLLSFAPSTQTISGCRESGDHGPFNRCVKWAAGDEG